MTNILGTKFPTIYDVASGVRNIDLTKAVRRGRPSKANGFITDGLIPESVPELEHDTVVTLSPSQIASLSIPILDIRGDDRYQGFQRDHSDHIGHVNALARYLASGKSVPHIDLSICLDTGLYIEVDGFGRSLGAIMAGVSLKAIATRRTFKESREMYVSQAKALKPRSNNIMLSGHSDIEVYIQRAFRDQMHAWFGMITESSKDASRISADAAFNSIGAYAFSVAGGYKTYSGKDDFNHHKANELAHLVRAFQSQKVNKSPHIKGIAKAAADILKFNGGEEFSTKERQRWDRLMPDFDEWDSRSNRTTANIIFHWNKHLSETNKVPIK